MKPDSNFNLDMTERLEKALEHYANVHRGCGHRSRISTALYERARHIVSEHLGCSNKTEVIFCSPFRLQELKRHFGDTADLKTLTSATLGLPIGLCAVAVPKKLLKKKTPSLPGGGTVKLVSKRKVAWADGAERFEAGTPHIFGAIAMAQVLMQKVNAKRNSIFTTPPPKSSASLNNGAAEIFLNDSLTEKTGMELLFALKRMIVSDASNVPTSTGAQRFVNFDYAASTPTFRPIWEAVLAAWSQPLSVQKALIEKSRSQVLEFFGADANRFRMVFASNTTEAIHLAAMGFAPFCDNDEETVIVNTDLEHNSNELIWRTKKKTSLIHLQADSDGFISLRELENLLSAYNADHNFGKKRIRLVCVTAASNVMGSCNNLNSDRRGAGQLRHRKHGIGCRRTGRNPEDNRRRAAEPHSKMVCKGAFRMAVCSKDRSRPSHRRFCERCGEAGVFEIVRMKGGVGRRIYSLELR